MSKQTGSENKINLLDIMLVLAKNKRLIITLVLGITVIALAASLLWPKTYKSTVRFLPPVQQGGLPAGLGMLGSMLPMQISSEKLNPEAAMFVLRSRELRERVIDEFNFREVYKKDIMESLLRTLDRNTRVEVVREGGFGFNPIVAVEFSFIDKDPVRARNVADFFITRLDSIVRNLNALNLKERLELVENRYLKNLNDLAQAEDELKVFQERYGILEVEAQSKALIETLADIKAQSIELDLKINLVSQNVGPENMELRNLQRSRNEIDRKYDELIARTEVGSEPGTDIFYPLLDMPGLAQRYMRKYREVVIQNRIYEMILPQYEQQLMLSGDTSRNIQIVDQANLPTYKYKPKRAVIVLGGFVFSIFLSFMIVFFREILDHGREGHSDQYRKIQAIKSYLRGKPEADQKG